MEGNIINCFLRDQSLSDLLYSMTKTIRRRNVKTSDIENFSINDFEKCADSQMLSSCHLQSHIVHGGHWSLAAMAVIGQHLQVTVHCYPPTS